MPLVDVTGDGQNFEDWSMRTYNDGRSPPTINVDNTSPRSKYISATIFAASS